MILQPFTIIFTPCASGRYLAQYYCRQDIIANGDNELEAEKNLVELYSWAIKYEKFEPLKDDLCLGCGEKKPQGIISSVSHGCPVNTVTYRIYGGAKISSILKNMFFGEMCFIEKMKADLLQFEHFKPMPDFDTATWIEKNNYLLARQSDIRTMKRLRAYIELEEELDAKY